MPPPNARTYVGITDYLNPSSDGICQELYLSNSINTDSELFAYIELLAEVKGKAEGVFSRNNPNSGKPSAKALSLFKSYIKQAKLYYFSAKAQDPSIAALNYYYSFLNLVKAYCISCNPSAFLGNDNRISHGIQTGKFKDKIKNQKLVLGNSNYPENVFKIFYENLTGQTLPVGVKVSIPEILAYCQDIGQEFYTIFVSPPLYYSGKVRVVQNNNKYWSLMLINNPYRFEKDKKIKKILDNHNYERVGLNTTQYKELFEMSLNSYVGVAIYQGQEVDFPILPLNFIAKDFHGQFFPYCNFEPRKYNFSFLISRPLYKRVNRRPVTIAFNEQLAIFTNMFYLSELVRYNPAILQSSLANEHGWLMMRFVVNTPQTFLRYMVNILTGENNRFYS